MSGTAAFFQAMAPTLIANVLTVVFVYCFAVIGQRERNGDEEGRLTYLWLIVLIFLFMLYGLYTWGVYPLDKSKRSASAADGNPPYVKRDQSREHAFFNKHPDRPEASLAEQLSNFGTRAARFGVNP